LALAVLSGCGYHPPYSTTKVSGKCTYEDGTTIPGIKVTLFFHSLTPPIDERTTPKVGQVDPDPKTGQFDTVSTFAYGDGIITGEHKVVIRVVGNNNAVPEEYTKVETTPLKVKSSDSPFTFKIPKPH